MYMYTPEAIHSSTSIAFLLAFNVRIVYFSYKAWKVFAVCLLVNTATKQQSYDDNAAGNISSGYKKHRTPHPFKRIFQTEKTIKKTERYSLISD